MSRSIIIKLYSWQSQLIELMLLYHWMIGCVCYKVVVGTGIA